MHFEHTYIVSRTATYTTKKKSYCLKLRKKTRTTLFIVYTKHCFKIFCFLCKRTFVEIFRLHIVMSWWWFKGLFWRPEAKNNVLGLASLSLVKMFVKVFLSLLVCHTPRTKEDDALKGKSRAFNSIKIHQLVKDI
jgi:hypothetical protein